MGDMTKEPSMEEILSSIKRIIAEDGDDREAPAGKERRGRSARDSVRKVPVSDLIGEDADDDAVLELTDAVAEPARDSFDTMLDDDLIDDEPLPLEIAEAAPEELTAEELTAAEPVAEVKPVAEAAPAPVSAPAAARVRPNVKATVSFDRKQTQGSGPVKEGIVSVESEVAARSSLAAVSLGAPMFQIS
ncbi:MAG: hypothetical protein ABI395_06675, partial [Sphingobium sp.]